MRLGTLLLRDAVISLTQLEAALRAQVIYGGRLGTNLVELGFLDLDTLSGYLARVLGLPQATTDHFERAPAEALDALGSGLAEVYTAVPLGFEDGDGGARVLALALADAKDRHVLEKLRMQTGFPVRAYCAPELRLYYYLEKHYQLARKARFIRAGTNTEIPSHLAERRRTQPARGVESPPEVLLAPRPDTDKTFEGAEPPATLKRLDYDEAVRRLERTGDRNVVGEVLMDFAAGRFGAAILFVVRDKVAIGWRTSSVDSLMEASVEELSLGLGAASVLQMAYDTGEFFRGSSPSVGFPVERRMWEAMGVANAPNEMLVVPIKIGTRVINLFYLHPMPGQGFVDEAVDETRALAVRAGFAFSRMIEKTKQSPGRTE